MLLKKSLLVALAMSFSASAFALVGGPFDNGDFSQLLDQNGIYQWVASFPNGLGQGQFNDASSVGPTLTGSTSGTATTNTGIGTVQDRSIFYYKGVTFFGQCFGQVDLSSKTISCVTNGSSDTTISTSSSSSNGSSTGQQTATSASGTITDNGNLGMVANSEWNGNITSTNPTLVFHGTGQLTVIPSQCAVAHRQLGSSPSSPPKTVVSSLWVVARNRHGPADIELSAIPCIRGPLECPSGSGQL